MRSALQLGVLSCVPTGCDGASPALTTALRFAFGRPSVS